MKWSLIGASDIAATRLIPAMRELGHEVYGVMSSSADRAKSYAVENGISNFTTSLEEAVNWPVDAVYVSTTNELHAEQAIAAARAKKHVLCEKPLAMEIATAKKMVEIAAECGVVFATNHHLRCSGTHRKIREIISTGKIGTVFSARINHAVSLPERLRGWRLDAAAKGAGVVLDIVVHDVDTIRAALGADVVEVTTLVSTQSLGQNGIEDSSMCSFRMSNGALVSTHESFVVPYGVTSFEINGSAGSIIATNVMGQDPVGEIRLRTAAGDQIIEPDDRENLYVYSLRKFEAATKGNGSPAADGKDGIASLAGAVAALESAKQKKTIDVVALTQGAN
jgi:1,5-anhydro-D-fructose reductase (1,5-anhydro-D-mannitol-forming)